MGLDGQTASVDWAPFRIEPTFVERVWGYRDLRPWFDFQASGAPVGEVWLTGDQCKAATGAHAGESLGAMFERWPAALLGAGAPAAGSPVLIKVLFAKEKLSVQVHPDDKLAQKYGQPRGKSECWYALSAEPGAEVAVGLKPGISIEQIRADIEAVKLEPDLNLIPVFKGDMVLVDAGTVHAVWPGSILLEVQENSDITYRLYDYGRPRELHVEKGLEAVRTAARAGKIAPQRFADRTILVDAEYFRVEQVPVTGKMTGGALRGTELDRQTSGLAYLFAAAGSARIAGYGIEPLDLGPRSMACVPASAGEFTLEDQGGLDLIRITPKWPA
jgi:mannose-6-phosphate isomerase